MASKESLVSVLMTNNAGSVKCSLKHNKPRFVHISPSHLLIAVCRLLGVRGPPGLMRARARPPMSPHVTCHHQAPEADIAWWIGTQSVQTEMFSHSRVVNLFLTHDKISSHSDSNHDLRRLEASRSGWWDVMTIVWPLEGTETYFTPNISIEAHYGTNSRWLTERRGDQR